MSSRIHQFRKLVISKWLLLLAAFVLGITLLAQKLDAQKSSQKPLPSGITLPLWPNGAPGAQPNPKPEMDTTTSKDDLVAGKPVIRLGNVSTPTLTFYPAEGKNSGAAAVVFPGGGYKILAMDLEGTEVCDWLTSAGINCVLLKYRVQDSGPYPKSSAALQDAQRAVGMVRFHAAAWHIDSNRVGVLGFSAGGHLAVALSTHFEKRLYKPIDAADQLDCRPNFAVIVYPAYLVVPEQNYALDPEISVTDKTAPSFIVQAENDPLHVENATAYFLALKKANVPAELHVYAEGGHGYGRRRTDLPVTAWPQLVETWLHTIRILQPSTP